MGKKPRPFHNPFESLKDRLPRPERRGRGAAPPPPPAPDPPCGPVPSDDDLWRAATAGVRRVARGPDVAPAPPPPRAEGRVWYPDLDAVDELRALVRGDAPFDLADSDEFIEGWVHGLDPAVVRKLRRGEFAVQGHLDLHGLTREEAKGRVDAFLRASRSGGRRCVLLVHGRGMHSRDQVPVLKEALRGWLATNRFARHVLAFATARPVDGGPGAIYVLLRRAGR
ncbi:MAG TPA: Smr/MutS family protein [Anaeromyxobacteraceae bacterium]|nr:Smr/MutS family protein [Anaeromyxobacteraceae bacterium]